jgi:hypothetical protein
LTWLLQQILDFLSLLVCWIMTALVLTLNLLLAALGTLIEGFVILMPDMPDLPTMPGAMLTALAWINWFFPVGTVVQILTFLFGAWLLWQAVVLILRWAKATNA